MGTYAFECEKCGRRFREQMSPVEHYQNRPECPSCHSDEGVHGAPLADADDDRR
ncbi:MAG: Zinc ribbon domain [bacterium]|nr:Zinc ribbon domain [bacterium]